MFVTTHTAYPVYSENFADKFEWVWLFPLGSKLKTQDHLNLHLLHILIENLVTQTTSTIINVSTFLFSCCNPLYVVDFCHWCSYGHSSYWYIMVQSIVVTTKLNMFDIYQITPPSNHI